MRSHQLVVGLVFAGLGTLGCATTVGSHGKTKQLYAGGVTVVLTNALPDELCSFHMSAAGERGYGDNWLGDELASGASIELRVKPGTYKATWNTCKEGDRPYVAGTLMGERAFHVSSETQLFAFVADKVAPTTRAATRGPAYQLIKFPGQRIDPTADPRAVAAADARAEAVAHDSAAPAPAKVDFSDMIERRDRPNRRKRLAPSFARANGPARSAAR